MFNPTRRAPGMRACNLLRRMRLQWQTSRTGCTLEARLMVCSTSLFDSVGVEIRIAGRLEDNKQGIYSVCKLQFHDVMEKVIRCHPWRSCHSHRPGVDSGPFTETRDTSLS